MTIPDWVKNQVGEQYGMLRVVEAIRAWRRMPKCGWGKGKIEYEVRAVCECGSTKLYTLGNLRSRHSSSCGCTQKDKSGKRHWNNNAFRGVYS